MNANTALSLYLFIQIIVHDSSDEGFICFNTIKLFDIKFFGKFFSLICSQNTTTDWYALSEIFYRQIENACDSI